MYRLRLLITSLFLFVCTIQALCVQPSPPVDNEMEDFHNKLHVTLQATYNFAFQRADSLIDQIKYSHPQHPWSYLIDANYHWWLLISGEDKELHYQACLENLDTAIAALDRQTNGITDIPDNLLYSYISTYAFKARLKILRERYMQSVWYLDDCIGYIRESFDKEKQFGPFNLTSGLYYYFVAHGRQSYPYLYPALVFYPAGEKEKGLSFLKRATNVPLYHVETEAYYFLMKIYFEVEKDMPKAAYYARHLAQLYQQNLLYQYFYYKILVEQGKTDKARTQKHRVVNLAHQNDQLSEEQRQHFIELVQHYGDS